MTGAQLGSSAQHQPSEHNGTKLPPTKTRPPSPSQHATQSTVKALSPNGILQNGARSEGANSVTRVQDTPSKMLPQPPTVNGTANHDHRSELDKNLVAIDLKNLKENSNLVKNLQSYGLGMNGGVDYTNSTITSPTTPTLNTPKPLPPAIVVPQTPKITPQPGNANDDTDDSKSPNASGSEDANTKKWEKGREDISWRWHWLDLQVRELQHQIQACDQLYAKHRRAKQAVLPLIDENDPSHALRTSGMVKPKKSRKLCRKAPTTLSTRVAIFDGADTHPLFSFPEKKHVTQPPTTPKTPVAEKAIKSEPQDEKTPQSTPASKRKREKPAKEEKEAEVAATPPPARKKRPSASETMRSRSPSPVRTPTSARREPRRALRARDFDIDDVVVPFTGSAAIPVLQVKEIYTPKWRVAKGPAPPPPPETPPPARAKRNGKKKPIFSPATSPPTSPPIPSPIGSPASIPLSASDSIKISPKAPIPEPSPKTPRVVEREPEAHFTILADSSNGVPSPTEYPEEGSSSEDTSDEAIALRHSKQELEERRRYIVPQQKKKKKPDSENSISNVNYFFVTSSEDLLSSYSRVDEGSLLSEADLIAAANSSPPVESPSPSMEERPRRASAMKSVKDKVRELRYTYDESDDDEDYEEDSYDEESDLIARMRRRKARRSLRPGLRRSDSALPTSTSRSPLPSLAASASSITPFRSRRRGKRGEFISEKDSATASNAQSDQEAEEEYDSDEYFLHWHAEWEASCTNKQTWWWDPTVGWELAPKPIMEGGPSPAKLAFPSLDLAVPSSPLPPSTPTDSMPPTPTMTPAETSGLAEVLPARNLVFLRRTTQVQAANPSSAIVPIAVSEPLSYTKPLLPMTSNPFSTTSPELTPMVVSVLSYTKPLHNSNSSPLISPESISTPPLSFKSFAHSNPNSPPSSPPIPSSITKPLSNSNSSIPIPSTTESQQFNKPFSTAPNSPAITSGVTSPTPLVPSLNPKPSPLVSQAGQAAPSVRPNSPPTPSVPAFTPTSPAVRPAAGVASPLRPTTTTTTTTTTTATPPTTTRPLYSSPVLTSTSSTTSNTIGTPTVPRTAPAWYNPPTSTIPMSVAPFSVTTTPQKHPDSPLVTPLASSTGGRVAPISAYPATSQFPATSRQTAGPVSTRIGPNIPQTVATAAPRIPPPRTATSYNPASPPLTSYPNSPPATSYQPTTVQDSTNPISPPTPAQTQTLSTPIPTPVVTPVPAPVSMPAPTVSAITTPAATAFTPVLPPTPTTATPADTPATTPPTAIPTIPTPSPPQPTDIQESPSPPQRASPTQLPQSPPTTITPAQTEQPAPPATIPQTTPIPPRAPSLKPEQATKAIPLQPTPLQQPAQSTPQSPPIPQPTLPPTPQPTLSLTPQSSQPTTQTAQPAPAQPLATKVPGSPPSTATQVPTRSPQPILKPLPAHSPTKSPPPLLPILTQQAPHKSPQAQKIFRQLSPTRPLTPPSTPHLFLPHTPPIPAQTELDDVILMDEDDGEEGEDAIKRGGDREGSPVRSASSTPSPPTNTTSPTPVYTRLLRDTRFINT